jgi:uncharacterized protein (DUF488 family)
MGIQQQARFFTVGYQRRDVDGLITTLHEQGVTTLIDVRYVAFSRKPGFSRSALQGALEGAGLRYEHWKALGNPPEIRDLYKSGQMAEGRRLFRERLQNGQSETVDLLVSLAAEERVAILCLEADHRECHRDVIADEAALRTGYRLGVIHL